MKRYNSSDIGYMDHEWSDCPKCEQTIQNCECHIPDSVKHAGLVEFIDKLPEILDKSKKDFKNREEK